MKSKTFGTLVAGAVVGLVSNVALANDAKKAPEKKEEKKPAAGAAWCKANDCGGKIAGAKNSCKGAVACQGITKAACEKDGHGTWTTEAKPH